MHLNLTGGSGFLLTTKYGYYPSRHRRRRARLSRALLARAVASSRLFSKSLSVAANRAAVAASLVAAAAAAAATATATRLNPRASATPLRRLVVARTCDVVDFLVRFHQRNPCAGSAEIEAQKLTVQEDRLNSESSGLLE